MSLPISLPPPEEAKEIVAVVPPVPVTYFPGPDGERSDFDFDLRPFSLQEGKHLEVAVPFRGLRPEFAGDFDHGFGTQVIALNGIKEF